MTIPSKGTRKVTVAGVAYAWHVRKAPTYSEGAFQTPMRVAIQRCDEHPCNVLLVSLGVSRPDNWIAGHQTSLTPAVVRSIIDAALEAGWDPSRRGPAFNFEYRLILDRP